MSALVSPPRSRRIRQSPLPQITMHHIPSGFRGTTRTLAHMRRLMLEGAKDFTVRQQAIAIVRGRGVRPRDYHGEIKALFEWVQSAIRYTRDPVRVELLHSPRRMLELRAGDCDDMAILLGALLQSIGHAVRLVVVGPDPRRPRLFTHVYLEAFHRGRWIPLDATMPHAMGWAPRAWVRKVVAVQRRRHMTPGEISLDGTLLSTPGMAAARGLLVAVRGAGLQPRDPRVRAVWNMLRRRGLLQQDPWVRSLLRRIWSGGLGPRPRPRTAARLEAALRRAGLITAQVGWPGVWQDTPDTTLFAPGGGGWTLELISAARTGRLRPRDPRVRALWRLLQRQGTLRTDIGTRRLLLNLWRQGGAAGALPADARRLAAVIRRSGIARSPVDRTRPWRAPGGARVVSRDHRYRQSYRPPAGRPIRRLAPLRSGR